MRILVVMIIALMLSACVEKRPKSDGREVNPFSPISTLEFELEDTSHVTALLYSIEGRVVDTLIDLTYGPGRHEVPFETDTSIAAGKYFIKWMIADSVFTRMHVVLK